MSCQVCFEDDAPIASNHDIGGALCCRSCPARVCVSCLARHVQVSLAGCFAGVLPLVRCPICLVPMRVDRWTRPLGVKPSTAKQIYGLRTTYETRCQQACALTPPCCHKANYTQLPPKKLHDLSTDEPLRLLPSKVVDFRKLVARFCGHRVDARDVLAFSIDNFGEDNTHKLMDRTLRRIADSERRARLLLAFVHQFPKIKTRCCDFAMCFNCKRIGHHDKCADFEEAVDEAQCLVRCRKCRVMLMKVQGCDTVDCACGFRMSWSVEVELRTKSKKKLLPVDLFDMEAVDEWQKQRGHAVNVQYELAVKHAQLRRQRLDAWIHKHKSLVYRSVAHWVWRMRFSAVLLAMSDEYEQRRRKLLDIWTQEHKVGVFRLVERWAWRFRFSMALAKGKRELFWGVYFRAHPGETVMIREEENALFAIDV